MQLGAQSDVRDGAMLLSHLEALEQQMNAVAESHTIAIAQWLVEAFGAIVPTLIQDQKERRIAAAAAVLHRTLRSMNRIEICDDRGTAIACGTAEDAWRELTRLREESADAGVVSVCWPRGRASFDDSQI
ncbi:MAG: hypothetical protein ACJ8AW_02720, partial [Rhodopila sp.]